MTDPDTEPTLGRLVEQLSEQTSRLVRAEVALAKAEMAQKAKSSGLGIGLFLAAGAISLYALGVLIWSAVLGLGEAWPLWLSALVIGFAMLLLAGGLVAVGVRLLQHASGKPEAIDRVKSDIATVRANLSSTARKEKLP
ncbi:phage holin family protein [Xylanimonas protaetiae]|uniref:Phage holin family protein n=1 Tax=Xylanimonas protaetiae TaxID=2509457 RepID=A0A4V0YFX8_9MICO|nr:phage holin family protein [Xylanimonas protaetiae]QAY69261.1 phage holin family protein [Xylanimonas protaetiae]